MVTQETKKDEVIREGESTLRYECGGCHKPTEVPFNYSLRHQLIEHHGQFVEGDQEEWLRVETSLPEQLQCGDCGAVHNVGVQPAIYANYSNPQGLSLYSEIMAAQSRGSKDNIDWDLEKAINSVSVEFAGTPERV